MMRRAPAKTGSMGSPLIVSKKKLIGSSITLKEEDDFEEVQQTFEVSHTLKTIIRMVTQNSSCSIGS